MDSHLDVPLIDRSRAQLEACELVPFKAAIAAGVQSIMTGHLMIPAYDPDLPATLSRRILTGLLREELGFQGLIVTDGIEMQGVSRKYGLAGATVRAIVAGSDAICVGGGLCDEQTASQLRDAIVAAVLSGELTEARLQDAAARVQRLAGWTVRTQTAVGARTADAAVTIRREVAMLSPVGMAAARRAVKLTVGADAPVLPLQRAPHVVEFAPERNIAIGEETPWGVGEPLGDLLHGTTRVRLDAGDVTGAADPAALVLAGSDDRPLVLVVRDVHRHPWIATALARTLAVRPDAIVVEMGLPVAISGGLHIATYGATRSCGQAAAEVIAGAGVPAPQPMAA